MNADERETGIDSKIMQQQFISAIEGTTSTDTASGASKTTKKPKTSRKPKSKSKISGESTKSRKSKAAPLNTTSIVNAVEKTGTMTTKPKRVRVKKSTAKQEQILGVEDILNDISAKKTVVGVADQKPNESGKMVTGTKLPPRKKSSVVVKNKTAEVNKPGAVHNNTEEPKIASNEPAGDKKKNRKRASKNETADEPEPKPKRQRKKKVQSPECSEVVLGDSGIVCEAKSNTTPMDNQRSKTL